MNDDTELATRRRWRRRLLVATAVAAAGLLAVSSAWACTLRIGDLKVCRTGAVPQSCSEVFGPGSQAGLAQVDDNGSSVTITGEFFLVNVPYTITWRHPGSTSNCHRTSGDGSVVSLVSGTVTGPSFTATATTPSTASRTPSTGLARICAQDNNIETLDQSVVTGNVLDVDVVML